VAHAGLALGLRHREQAGPRVSPLVQEIPGAPGPAATGSVLAQPPASSYQLLPVMAFYGINRKFSP
jgi:hypothetical protein